MSHKHFSNAPWNPGAVQRSIAFISSCNAMAEFFYNAKICPLEGII